MQQRQRPGLHDPGRNRRHGLPRWRRDPQLLGVRQELRAAGPHVRAQPLVEPAAAPVHGLRVVGAVHDRGQPAELYERAGTPRPAAGLQQNQHRPRLCLDRSHLPLAPPRRELGLLRLRGRRARLRGRRKRDLRARRPERQNAGHLEPAAVFRHRARRRAARRRAVAERLLHSGPRGHAARGVVGVAELEGVRAPARQRQRRPGVRHEPRQRRHAQPRLAEHGDLHLLG